MTPDISRVKIFVEFGDDLGKRNVLTFKCSYNPTDKWYCSIHNLNYLEGKLNEYLHPIVLSMVNYLENNTVREFGAQFFGTRGRDHKYGIDYFWYVCFNNKHLQNGSLDRYKPRRNGKLMVF